MNLNEIIENAEREIESLRAKQEQARHELSQLDAEAQKWLKVIRALAPERLERTSGGGKRAKKTWKVADEKLAHFEGLLRASLGEREFTSADAHKQMGDLSRSFSDKILQTLREMGVIRLSGRTVTGSGRGFQHTYRFTDTTLIPNDTHPADEALALVGEEAHA